MSEENNNFENMPESIGTPESSEGFLDNSADENDSQLDKTSKTDNPVIATQSQLEKAPKKSHSDSEKSALAPSSLSLESQIEAILFWKGEPMSIKELAKFFGVKSAEIEVAISALETSLKTGSAGDGGRGLALVRNGTGGEQEVMLYTSPAASELIQRLTKEELSRDVSKAGVEVLSLILYRGPIAKREIDYIRGVNSGFILRNLMVRGLIERADAKDARSFIYQPTFELLAKLGVSRKEDLPDFAQVQKDIEAFVAKEETM